MRKWLLVGVIILVCMLPLQAGARIYRWVDEKGVEHFTNDEEMIPPVYRSKVVTSLSLDEQRKSIGRTVINFEREGSAILVNGVLNRKLPVVFHLDTGASETLITEEDARQLELDTGYAPRVPTRIADGREVEFPRVRLKSLRVGKAEVRELEVLVGQVRLLGLSFLNEFKVTMNSEQGQLILEASERRQERESSEVVEEKERLVAEYEAKQDKLKLSIEAVRKNIAIVESEITSLQNQQSRLQEVLAQAREQEVAEEKIDEIKAVLQRVQLAIDGQQLKIEGYKKDIEILENNIEYYENQIYKFK